MTSISADANYPPTQKKIQRFYGSRTEILCIDAPQLHVGNRYPHVRPTPTHEIAQRARARRSRKLFGKRLSLSHAQVVPPTVADDTGHRQSDDTIHRAVGRRVFGGLYSVQFGVYQFQAIDNIIAIFVGVKYYISTITLIQFISEGFFISWIPRPVDRDASMIASLTNAVSYSTGSPLMARVHLWAEAARPERRECGRSLQFPGGLCEDHPPKSVEHLVGRHRQDRPCMGNGTAQPNQESSLPDRRSVVYAHRAWLRSRGPAVPSAAHSSARLEVPFERRIANPRCAPKWVVMRDCVPRSSCAAPRPGS